MVAQFDTEAALLARGFLPTTITTAHHNAIAGRDEWRSLN
jgi:hypothetical protein